MQESRKVKEKSYETVKKAIGDPFIVSKLQFFTYVSSLGELFLTLFQTEKPMIPVMYLSLKDLVLKLFKRIVKPNVLESYSTGCKLKTNALKRNEKFASC